MRPSLPRYFGPSLGLLTVLGLQACAPAATDAMGGMVGAGGTAGFERPERQCFRASQVTNFRADRQTVYVKVGQRAVYALETAGACMDLDSAFRVAMVPTGGASSLCTGDMATLVTPGDARQTEVCRVRITHRLSEAEIAALPSRLRP